MLKRPETVMKPESLQDHRAARQDASGGDGAAAEPETPGGDRIVSFETAEAVKRARRVEELREAVQNGAYRADPGATAAAMMENER